MTQLRKRLSRPALFFKGLFDKKVRLHTEALQAKLQAATQLRALFAAGQAEVEVLDVKSELSVAGRLEVGTTLWLVSVAFPFNRRGPELIEVTVAEVDEWTHYLNSDSESVYEGAQVNVDYTHEVAVPPRSGGWDGPEGRRENLKNFKLDAGPLPEELPWNISGERLFTSKKAARKVLLELADKCLAAANA